MKNRTWIMLFAALLAVCLGAMALLGGEKDASFARITVDGATFATVSLDRDQVIDVGGTNTVTVKDSAIAVTWADCPDQYCVKRGFRSGGASIICLPHRLEIRFLDQQDIDGAAG